MNIPKSIFLAGLLGVVVGCHRNAGSAPLKVTEMPAAVKQMFDKSAPAVQQQADDTIAALQKNDLPSALEDVVKLNSHSLSADQHATLARAQIGLCLQLQDAADHGDAAAAAALRHFAATR